MIAPPVFGRVYTRLQLIQFNGRTEVTAYKNLPKINKLGGGKIQIADSYANT
jgi:hypothetical protein